MSITAFMFYSNGAPIVERQYTSPGQYYMDQATVVIDKPMAVGDVRLIHMGHGQFHRFECVEADAKHALLQGCAH